MALVTKHLTCRQSSWSILSLKLSVVKSELSPSTSSTLPITVQIYHIDFRNLESSMPIFLVNWTPRITSWAYVSKSTTLGVCPFTWIVVTTLALGLRPRQGLVKVRTKSEPKSHISCRSARECKGMNPHTPKWAPTLGVGVSMESQIFKRQIQGSNFIGLKGSLYHWKALGT